ncbi:DUF4349 domain-containing protein [Hyphomonas johnsonii]|jgi:hypothetical protein|uniref:Putative lipoprotein n=1 Tax=Hyphomonas johnsonii MHS-2 TaxID=1280950 RepID=A0A059FLZ3_9PROT|nr:DUF4349 domain-containing protein [Hyphomonas johnsonii]KCZ91705.1 putative lipoprotein [Hyphomonas johnsonii MHS-2]
MNTYKLLIGAAAALALAACGGPGSMDRSEAVPSMAPPPPAPMMEAGDAAPMQADGAAPAEPGVQQYIAYSHAIGMRLPVKSIEPVMQGHIAACKAAGPDTCIITNSYLNAWSEDEASGSLYLRAIPAWIDTFLGGVEAEADAVNGEVTSRQTTAEDLTVTIIDTDARLKAQEALQTRIQQLLDSRPGDLGELLDTERELARVNGEIDSLKSSKKALMARVNMSQLSVSYETKRNPVSRGALEPLGNAFGGFFYNLSSAVAAVITAFAVGLPWLLLLGFFLWFWLKLIWPRIRRKKT